MTHLLANGDLRAFKASTHTTSTETALGNLPEAIDDGVKYEVVLRRSESQATPMDNGLRNVRQNFGLWSTYWTT